MDEYIILSDLKTAARNVNHSFKSGNITGLFKVLITELKNTIMKVRRSCDTA